MNADENSYLFLLIIFYHSFDHINNFIIICDRIKINCHKKRLHKGIFLFRQNNRTSNYNTIGNDTADI
jgi:hypothetical protein